MKLFLACKEWFRRRTRYVIESRFDEAVPNEREKYVDWQSNRREGFHVESHGHCWQSDKATEESVEVVLAKGAFAIGYMYCGLAWEDQSILSIGTPICIKGLQGSRWGSLRLFASESMDSSETIECEHFLWYDLPDNEQTQLSSGWTSIEPSKVFDEL